MRSVVRIASALVLAGTVAACGAAASPSPAAIDMNVIASEFAFDPASVDVAAGSDVRFTLDNKGTIEHDLTIDALDFVLYAAVGQSPTLTLKAPAAGTYDFHCSIIGHKEAGMVGTLVVK